MVVLVDVDVKENKDLKQKYGVKVLPTFVVVDDDGAVIDAWMGYGQPEGWGEQLQQATADPAPVTEKRARFARRPDVATGRCLARVAEARGDLKRAVALLDTLAILDPEGAAAHRTHAVGTMSWGLGRGLFQPDEVFATARKVLDDPHHTPQQVLDITSQLQNVADRTGDNSPLVPFLEAAMRESAGSDDPQVVAQRRDLAPAHALLVEKDTAKAVRLKRAAMPEGWEQDSRWLNDYAWWCAQNGLDLAAAEELAARAAGMVDDPKEKSNILDTLAEVQFRAGKAADALATERQALELQPDSDYLKKQVSRFAEAAGDQPAAGSSE